MCTQRRAALMPALCTVPFQPVFLSLNLSVFSPWVKNTAYIFHTMWFPTTPLYFPQRKKINFTEQRKGIIYHLANCRVWVLAFDPITHQENSATEQTSQSMDEVFSNSLSKASHSFFSFTLYLLCRKHCWTARNNFFTGYYLARESAAQPAVIRRVS